MAAFRKIPRMVNLSFAGLHSEPLMIVAQDWVPLSNGSACTSSTYTPSHVLKVMGLDEAAVSGALRFLWCHLTAELNWDGFVSAVNALR